MALCYCEHICFISILFRHPVLEKLIFKGLIILGQIILLFTLKNKRWKQITTPLEPETEQQGKCASISVFSLLLI